MPDEAHIKSIFVFSVFTLTGKPNSTHDSADGEEDGKKFNFQDNLNIKYIH